MQYFRYLLFLLLLVCVCACADGKVQIETETEVTPNKVDSTSTEFACLLTIAQQQYKIGETPDLAVSIRNNSDQEVYLLGSLDGSEVQWRMPYCYFKIEKPGNRGTPEVGRCGNMNSLRKENFTRVAPGATFDPYYSPYGYFTSYQISRKENFSKVGRYRITFYYSTKSSDLVDYLGDEWSGMPQAQEQEFKELLRQVPKLELVSNTVEIEMVE